MKITSVLAASVFLFASCANKMIPVKNEYVTIPADHKINNNFEKTWEKLLDLGVKNGYAIRLIDKGNGLIVFDNVAIPATWEGDNDAPVHPDAYVVIAKRLKSRIPAEVPIVGRYRVKSDLKKTVMVRGEWTVRVKNDESGVTVNAKLTRLRYVHMKRKSTKDREIIDFQSTGNFEESLAEQIR